MTCYLSPPSPPAASPNQPNGIIVEYRILQHQGASTSSGEPPAVVFAGLSLQTTISDLNPFTTYSFQVVAENGAGNTTSLPTTVTTLQAPPTPVDPPSVIVLSEGEVSVSWTPPDELNGELFGYQVYRNGIPILVELTTALMIVEQDLRPFTQYEYFVQVCASGGCANSTSVSNTTFEALPEMVFDVTVSSIQPRSLILTWQEPASPNGVITEYIVLLNTDSEVFRGLDFTVSLTNLVPFTNYSFFLMACNGAGCVSSDQVNAQTLETDPEGLDVPQLRNLSSTSVAIEWTPPALPNGEISSYILRRGNDSFPNISRIIFQGLSFSFNDLNLAADTLYFYTIEAVNGGGSTRSAPSQFRTVPDLAEGIRPPVLEVRGARDIGVTWSPPESANGVISAYRLYIDNTEVFSGLLLQYNATNLTPFTVYVFFVEVCNQAGCASSISATAQTQDAPAEGVTPPTLTVLGPTSINVSWTTPTAPNGIITSYQIRRRTMLVDITVQHFGPANILSFTNFGLLPFTSYEYLVGVTNGAGLVLSEWVSAQTTEDLPVGLTPPRFEFADIFSRNVTATWAPPTSPNGVLLRYILEYRLEIDPITFGPGEVVVAAEVSANVITATALGLLPVTGYEFRVVAVNSAGNGVGPFEEVTTGEDIPEQILPIIVEQRTGSSLGLSWNPPLVPNGIVREYMLLLNGETVYRDSALMFTITRLQPFTGYSLQLGACTGAGCGFGSIQSITTAEIAPSGQDGPALSVLDSGSVLVSWIPPSQPNGIITQYDILRRVNTVPPTATAEVVRTNSASFLSYMDTQVRPAQNYQYSIRAINSVGRTESEFRNITTPEDAPQGLTPPILTTINATTIQVSWLPPVQPNGVITMYQAFRRSPGSSTNESVFSNSTNRGFTDSDLLPFTEYTYFIQACTAAGCSSSLSTSITTVESSPLGLFPPLLTPLSNSIISIEWMAPSNPNGIIILYNITVLPIRLNIILREGNEDALNVNVTNLRPFTTYNVTLSACNTAGCAFSSGLVQTLQSLPEFINPPQIQALNATALRILWSEPARPNGIIVMYELRRNGSLVFSGDGVVFVDADLLPREFYSYTVQAYTIIGGGEESAPPSVSQTPSDTPQDVFAPSLLATSSSSILVMWREPDVPNGIIQRYILFLDGVSVFEDEDASTFETELTGLSPFTSYDVQLMVCTTTCGTSPIASALTLEAPPENQPAPTLSAANQIVNISWSEPSIPNGIVVRYELERRQVTDPPSTYILIISGSALSFSDEDGISPAMSYEYRVTAFNGVGNTTSDTNSVTLPEAPPQGVRPPAIAGFNATSKTVLFIPPDTPNGVVTAYRLFLNGTLVEEVSPSRSQLVLSDLSAFTVYEIYIEACTQAGCTRGLSLFQRTGEAPPLGLAPPVGVAQSARTIVVSWTPPQTPNGIIVK